MTTEQEVEASARRRRLDDAVRRKHAAVCEELARVRRLREENPDRTGIEDYLRDLERDRASLEAIAKRRGIDL
jgi:hypothetical protein